MPYANKQKQKAYLRDYMRERQRKKKKEDAEKAIDLTVKLTQRMDEHARTRREWLEMLNIIRVMAFTVSRTDLTDKEKIAQISKIPISDELKQYFKQRLKEVTA
jgi:uncharacterized protein with WD repeat